MSQPKKLTWNNTQTQIYNLLKAGMMPIKVAKQLGVHKSSVTKVRNAIKKGQSPVNPNVHSPKKFKHSSSLVKVKKNIDAVFESYDNPSENVNNPELAPSGDASVLLLKPISVEVTMTPIMINARYIAITELGWPADVSWEDFLDTCLVHCFRHWGWRLQNAYKLNDESHEPKVTSEKQNGFGQKVNG